MTPGAFEFNRITFGLPIESYRVDAFITRDERLPVVTEYVLRLLKVCNSLVPGCVAGLLSASPTVRRFQSLTRSSAKDSLRRLRNQSS
jgi:hypothetical protein